MNEMSIDRTRKHPSVSDRPSIQVVREHPGRWIGGLIGVLVSLALVPLSLVVQGAPTNGNLGALAGLGLLGAPIAFVLGRQLFPMARSDGWRSALAVGMLIGWIAPPLGAVEIVAGSLLLPSTNDGLSGTGAMVVILPFALLVSFVAIVVTIPVGLVWGVIVRLVPDDLPARLRVPGPFERLGVRHALLVVVAWGLVVRLLAAGPR